MAYRSLRQCLEDLNRHGHVLCIDDPVKAQLEAAEIHRRVYSSGGPALWFRNVAGCQFSMVSNLFGTLERARFIFRHTIENVRRAIELKIEPAQAARRPLRYIRTPRVALSMRPRWVRRGPVLGHSTSIAQLPQQISWPHDGGPFITLPQVYTEDLRHPGWQKSNLGMYRVQLSGGQYQLDQQIGLHYQIHRSIGVHHTAAREAGQPLRVNIFVGGHPAMTLAAVLPLPEGMSELTFAGALAGYRIPLVRRPEGLPIYGDADFCIVASVIEDKLLPEGPFGDHLGYYSLAHPFPVLQVEQVLHRTDAIWPFTVVGRPPQEDTTFGELIHELTGPVIPTVLPGVRAVHAVDAAGVHPLLLAIGSERYTPYQEISRPQELLTQANAILGQGQLSLAKYLWIIDRTSVPDLDIHDTADFIQRVLQRVDWSRDLHFQTQTTIDTLDYSGDGLNSGSKVVIAAVGPPRRSLAREIPSSLTLPPGWHSPRLVMPGVMVMAAPPLSQPSATVAERLTAPRPPAAQSLALGATQPLPQRNDPRLQQQCDELLSQPALAALPLIVLVDDSEFASRNLSNWLWVTFTRSDPAADIYGVGAMVRDKHWGCQGSLVIDARLKPHHAPPLETDPEISRRVDARAARGGPLAKYL